MEDARVKKEDTPEFVEKLEALLKVVPENYSLVLGLVILNKDDQPDDPMIELEHIVAYRGDYCPEALFGIMMDETLIDKGVVDEAFDQMKAALEDDNARSWEETPQDGADSDEGHSEGDASGAVQNP